MNWLDILADLGKFFIVSGVFAFLVRSIVNHWLSQDFEKFKAQLSKTQAVEIERFKSELHAASFEHETRFARLHEERARIIAKLYELLVDAENAIRTLHGPTIPADEKEREKQFWDAGKRTSEAYSYFDKTRIYFDEEICKMLDEHSYLFREAWLHGSPFVIKTIEEWKEARSKFDDLAKEIRTIRGAIEKGMREMLGVKSKQESE